MRLYDVLDAVLTEIEGSAKLSMIFGDAIRQARDGELQRNVIEYSVIGDAEEEVDNPIQVQFDIFTLKAADMIEAEIELRKLLHHDTPVTIQGIGMWSQFQARREIPDAPQNIVGVSHDYRFTPVRSKYTTSQES